MAIFDNRYLSQTRTGGGALDIFKILSQECWSCCDANCCETEHLGMAKPQLLSPPEIAQVSRDACRELDEFL